MSSYNCCFLTCIQVSQAAGQVVWYSHLFQNFPQFIVIHTVEGFGIVNKAEIDVSGTLLLFRWSSTFLVKKLRSRKVNHRIVIYGNLKRKSRLNVKGDIQMWKIYFRRLGFVLVSRGYREVPHTGGLQQQKCDRSGWEVFDLGTCRSGFPLKPAGEGRFPCLGQLLVAPDVPWLVAAFPPLFTCVLPVSLHQVLPLYMSELCVQISPSYKDTSHAELGPTLMTSSQLDYIFKDFISK